MPRLAFLSIIIIGYCLTGSAFGTMLTVEADEVQKTGPRIEAFGNVLVTGEGTTLRADYIVYDTSSEDIWATGDCRLTEEKGEVESSSLYFNARRKDMYVENGWVLIYSGPMKISGESIRRYGEDLYTGGSVEYTSCLGTPPDWSLEMHDLEIPVEGYATGKDVRFNLRTFPMLRIPYLLYPAKLKRQSGLLFPEISHSSDYGMRFGVPAFIVLGRSVDLTLTPTYLADRGLLLKNELRYSLNYEQAGYLYAEVLHDSRGGEESDGGVLDTIPKDRWFFKAEQTGGDLTWDVNLVSSPDYFRDIGTFYGSSFSSSAMSKDLFPLSDRDSEELISRGQWVKSGRGFSLAVYGQWKQDLSVQDNGMTLQELPRVSARMSERSIPYTPLRVTSELSSVRVCSSDWIDAVKDQGQIEVSWPISMFPYFTLRPYIADVYRDTRFTETKGAYPDSLYAEHWQKRGASLSTTLYSSRFGNSWYHQMIPEVSWDFQSRYGGNYSANNAEDIFPELLTDDDWEKTFDMNLSIANYVRDSAGTSLADLSLTRPYSYITREWGLIEATMNFRPASWLSASHTNSFGRENNRGPYATQEHSSRLTFTDDRGDQLYIAEDFNRIDTKSVKVGARADLIRGFSVGFETGYDYLRNAYEISRQSIGYTSQCWVVEAKREVDPGDAASSRDTTWSFTVRLLGLGDVGRSGMSPSGGQATK